MIPFKDENPTTRKPFLTIGIMIACVLTYFGPQEGLNPDLNSSLQFNLEYAAIPCELKTGEALSQNEVEAILTTGDAAACTNDGVATSPYAEKNVYLGALTSMFLHGGIMHLVGNVWFLWIFGNNIEDRLGHVPFALFYLVGGVVATLAHYAVQPSSIIPVVGASGAIAAIMGAYVLWFPNAPIRTLVFFMLRDISAKWFLGFWFIGQFFTGANSGVAWMAHVGGFVFGAIVGLVVKQTGFGERKLNRSDNPLEWDYSGGAGRGPLPHPFERTRGDVTDF